MTARSTCACCAATCRWCWTSTTTAFELGKAKLIRDGADALVISSGFMTMRALETAKLLEADRVNVAVLHVPTIKPLDEETILREAGRSGRLVVVAENHTVIGGLGEAVATALLRAGRARRSSGRSRCRTSSSTPARCRRCTTATASRPRRWRRASRAGCDRPRRTGVGDEAMTTVGFVGLGPWACPWPGTSRRVASRSAASTCDPPPWMPSSRREASAASSAAEAAAGRRRPRADGRQRRPGRSGPVRRRRARKRCSPDGIVVLMATCPPGAVESIAARVLAAGRRFVDAPVSGGVVGAVGGTLTVMAAAPRETFEPARPRASTRSANKVFHVGERPGPGRDGRRPSTSSSAACTSPWRPRRSRSRPRSASTCASCSTSWAARRPRAGC